MSETGTAHPLAIAHADLHDTLRMTMGTMLQIRDVPDDVHRTLKARAALAGVSLTEYVRRTLEQSARRPSREELLRDLAAIDPVDTGESAATALKAIRDERS